LTGQIIGGRGFCVKDYTHILINLSPDTEFGEEVLSHPGVVIVESLAPWCGTCRMMSHIVETPFGSYTVWAPVIPKAFGTLTQTAHHALLPMRFGMSIPAGKNQCHLTWARNLSNYYLSFLRFKRETCFKAFPGSILNSLLPQNYLRTRGTNTRLVDGER
jgi:hypothetical protein